LKEVLRGEGGVGKGGRGRRATNLNPFRGDRIRRGGERDRLARGGQQVKPARAPPRLGLESPATACVGDKEKEREREEWGGGGR
jgi:hypothetical protein